MKSKNELSYKDLKMTCNENLFNFNTTEAVSYTHLDVYKRQVQ